VQVQTLHQGLNFKRGTQTQVDLGLSQYKMYFVVQKMHISTNLVLYGRGKKLELIEIDYPSTAIVERM
jgi:hypothetical protein